MLTFERYGDTRLPALSFFHGFMGSCADWDVVIDAFLDEYHCIAFDLPGHGESRINQGAPATDMAGTAKSIVEAWDALGVKRSAIVGYSMGARLGLYLALKHASRIERAVLESASPGLATEAERAARRKRDEALATALEDSPLEAFVRWWYEQPMFATLKSDPVRFERLVAKRLQNDPRGLAASLRTLGTGAQPPLWNALKKNRVPMLLIAGGMDDTYAALAREIHEQTPLSTAQIVPACGHNVHFENPEEYIRHLKPFLKAK
ncbi:MAG: 2-succinyl-6-hydroxy-2,4-cyclohexadiene-1-carboxylate synthase [FCB group bacterium]|jgi:2-succinyl-6-hydroxy-2,4-cyclohexadiene-1-carboxylate synthase|nr:2-succinyl-6-hydroxy-2,4-cyclohexadiene-1-carboxylate synthase [FCB group bacterium]